MARMTIAGHSAHAIINDWPIGLFTTGFAFDVLHKMTGRQDFAKTGYYFQVSGYITGALAAITGIADYAALDKKGQVKHLANRHALVNSAIMALMGVSLFARRKNPDTVGALPLSLTAIANGLTILSAWYGDEMVYGHGVRVRDLHIKPGDKDLRLPGDEEVVEVLYAGV